MNRMSLTFATSWVAVCGALAFGATNAPGATAVSSTPHEKKCPALISLTDPKTGYDKAPAPCQAILQACDSAGYHYGWASCGKGLWLNCFDIMMKKDRVAPAGVSVSLDTIKECREMHRQHPVVDPATSHAKPHPNAVSQQTKSTTQAVQISPTGIPPK